MSPKANRIASRIPILAVALFLGGAIVPRACAKLIRVGVVQMVIEDRLGKNLAKILGFIDRAKSRGCQLVIFPEGALYWHDIAVGKPAKATTDAAVAKTGKQARQASITVIFGTSYAKPNRKPASGPLQATDPPYPPSPIIKGIRWHRETLRTAAPGSDLWPVTWGPDGHIYTSWGDGGGFAGTNSDGRVSMGFARLEGPPEKFVSVNINGGRNASHPASFPKKGKTAGILSVGGTLYCWLNRQDGIWPNVNRSLIWSDDLTLPCPSRMMVISRLAWDPNVRGGTGAMFHNPAISGTAFTRLPGWPSIRATRLVDVPDALIGDCYCLQTSSRRLRDGAGPAGGNPPILRPAFHGSTKLSGG